MVPGPLQSDRLAAAPSPRGPWTLAVRTSGVRLGGLPLRPQQVERDAPPASAADRDYRDLLSEANLNYFHREYSIALQNYIGLRQKILEQSHPELPRMPGAGGLWSLDWSKVQMDRIVELSRRVGGTITPGDRVRSPLTDRAFIRSGEFNTDPQLARWSTIGVDTRPPGADPALRDRARTLVRDAKFDEATSQYAAAAKAALSGGQNRAGRRHYRRAPDLSADTWWHAYSPSCSSPYHPI